jgi:hypothetical protein
LLLNASSNCTEEVKPLPYEWSQTLKEVTLSLPLPEGCNKRGVAVTFKPEHLKVVLKGNTVVDGALHKRIKVGRVLFSLRSSHSCFR